MQEVGNASNSSRHVARPLARPTAAAQNRISPKLKVPPRRPRSARTIFARKLASLLAAFLAATILSSLFASDAGRMRQLSDAVPEIDSVISFAGFGLDQVTIKGQRYALVADIFDALELEKSHTFADFDAAAARTRIEKIAWIATAELRRVYPNQLVVHITERSPSALWRDDGGRAYLVDKKGRVLSSIARADAPAGLTRIAGAGAPQAAAELWSDLARHPNLAPLVSEATRIGHRRWSLKLNNGAMIELPSGAVAAALKRLADWPGFAAIRNRGGAIVDMRTPGRIAVRPSIASEPVAQTNVGPKNISELLEPAG